MTTFRSTLHRWTLHRWKSRGLWTGGLLALLVACVGPGAHAGPTARSAPGQVVAAAPAAGLSIEITQHAFSPATLMVPIGTAVTWINHDEDVHTVTSPADVFTSKGLDTDDTFTYTFTRAGTYEYFCKLHPLMTGTIVVR